MAPPNQASMRAEAWLEVSDLLDLQLSPLGQFAIEALAPKQSSMLGAVPDKP